jgi:hypothetical protein
VIAETVAFVAGRDTLRAKGSAARAVATELETLGLRT